jgi:hypothetical protein
LIGVRASEIQVEAVAVAWAKPVLDVGAGVSGLRECFNDLRPDLAATDSKARTDRGNEVARIRSEVFSERAHRRSRRALRSSPPSGMSRGNDA